VFPGTHAALIPDKPAIIMGETGAVITYRELDEIANRLSHVFRSAGLQAGDHIAICLGNEAEFLSLIWGAHYAGLYYTPMSSRLTADEVSYIVNDCGAKAFVTSADHAAQAAAVLTDCPRVDLRLVLDGVLHGYQDYHAVIAATSPLPLTGRTEGWDMPYSSGTTGHPKGVKTPRPAGEFGATDPAAQMCADLFEVTDETVYLSPAPLYHAAPLRFCRSVLRFGATVVVMAQFDPERYLQLVEKHRVTFTQLVPTMFVRMLKLSDAQRSRYDVSSLQTVVHAAAPCPAPVKREMIAWWGPVIAEFYGGTEGIGFVYCTSEDWLAHEGTVSKALTGTLHILDDHGTELPVGEVGAVYIAEGGTFSYHNDAQKTASAMDPRGRGWSTLGDIGYLDADGFLYLTDRKAHMIIVGGVNVYPQETENMLTMHPKVSDVAVIGVPDAELGEQVKAVVQPAPGAVAGPELEAELIRYCRDHLAAFKCPRTVDFRDELPREPTGKLLKRRLKDEYWSATSHTG
jgi:acyl-CoA synthetase (AMP-forming)/AMP-acid ligase II